MNVGDRLESLRRGDDRARNELIEELLPQIEAYVRLNVGPALRARESCSDLVQTICREALADVHSFRGHAEGELRAWLLRLAQRKIHMRHRAAHAQRRDVRREVPLEMPEAAAQRRLLTSYQTLATPTRELSMREEVARIEAAIASLPDEQRRVLTMAAILGLSSRDIAEELDKQDAAVRKLLSRARVRMSLLLALDESDERE